MAFTEKYTQPQRWDHFEFYFSGKINGWEEQSLAPNIKFKINEIRLCFSTAFASVEDFVVRLSSLKGSVFNLIFVSQALNGVKDLLWQPSQELIFGSDDQIVFAGSMASNINEYGLSALGWAVRG